LDASLRDTRYRARQCENEAGAWAKDILPVEYAKLQPAQANFDRVVNVIIAKF
jgi:hypothetical protein